MKSDNGCYANYSKRNGAICLPVPCLLANRSAFDQIGLSPLSVEENSSFRRVGTATDAKREAAVSFRVAPVTVCVLLRCQSAIGLASGQSSTFFQSIQSIAQVAAEGQDLDEQVRQGVDRSSWQVGRAGSSAGVLAGLRLRHR